MIKFRLAYWNVDKRSTFIARQIRMLRRTRASVILLTECTAERAEAICLALGWGTKTFPAWVVDENRNAVLTNPRRWQDVTTLQVSLSKRPGDRGDTHNRSANWRLLARRATGERVWVGASHLSHTGDRNATVARRERESQARVLVARAPQTGNPRLLCLDRNCAPGSTAETILASFMPRLADFGGTFAGGAELDGAYGDSTVTLRWWRKRQPRGASDHSLLVLGVSVQPELSTA